MQQTPIKIVLLGPSGCGKSSILNKFCFDFGRVKSTIGCDHILMNIILKNKQYLVSVWDVSGLELQSPTMKIFLRDALGVFLVCDISNEQSQLDLSEYNEKVMMYCDIQSNLPVIVLQNKLDLLKDQHIQDYQNLQNLFEFCNKNEYLSAYQTSIMDKQSIRVVNAFEAMIQHIESYDLQNQLLQKNRIFITQNQSQYKVQMDQFDKQRNDCF